MSQIKDPQLAELQAQAGEAARFLKQIANEKRLLILCRLASGEATVSELCEVADLSQSAMSQHLSRMRAEGLVDGRREGLQVFYRLADERCLGMLRHLRAQFCTAAEGIA
ncbi:transcriptional regulator [Marinicauda salina]|uniref:Transcriptional regulator n=1 Tax=Marinicauda salina TaxID=2135793 RepID=A0A2U2BWZ6_9PROT|nr:metalloregulator ArsR/SmtB family transcription factor [Marinicauda salina]PWE18499.1 transcriptional regulator [Marinicauda salina]